MNKHIKQIQEEIIMIQTISLQVNEQLDQCQADTFRLYMEINALSATLSDILLVNGLLMVVVALTLFSWLWKSR